MGASVIRGVLLYLSHRRCIRYLVVESGVRAWAERWIVLVGDIGEKLGAFFLRL